MSDVRVADIVINGIDAAGAQILSVYARKPPDYAVYRTAEKVVIQYADDPATAEAQRKPLLAVGPGKGEINGLVDGWRTTPADKHFLFINTGKAARSRAERYDRRVADALVAGLEGDTAGALALLAKIKDDITNERIGWARFEYLVMAYATATVVTLMTVFVALVDRTDRCGLGPMLCFWGAWDVWRGGAAGAFGSFFSIALGIRGRTILPDLFRTSNLMDALLRIVIGAIAGAVLVALIDAKFIRFWIGDSSPSTFDTIHILVVGFVAGFAERLVPDLLAKADARTGGTPVIRSPEVVQPERPAGRTAGAPPSSPPPSSPSSAPVDDEQEDDCVDGTSLGESELTPDENLPAASGGVADPS